MDDESQLGANRATLPQYDPSVVAQLILKEAVELDPERLSSRELSLRIILNPDDRREVSTAMQAIRDLRQSGLLGYGDDEDVVAPTPAAVHAVALL